jgi:hypothetical protein
VVWMFVAVVVFWLLREYPGNCHNGLIEEIVCWVRRFALARDCLAIIFNVVGNALCVGSLEEFV